MDTAPQPYSLVWAPIPILSWIYPFIGHMGISKSDGTIYDFAGSIREGNMAFGGPARYYPLKPEQAVVVREHVNLSIQRLAGGASAPSSSLAASWDDFIKFSTEVYGHKEYSLLFDNCHNFVAYFLNSVRYGDSRQWSHVPLVWLMMSRGRWVDSRGFFRTVVPALVVLGLGCKFLGVVVFGMMWLFGLLVIVLWYTVFMNCGGGAASRNMLLSV